MSLLFEEPRKCIRICLNVTRVSFVEVKYICEINQHHVATATHLLCCQLMIMRFVLDNFSVNIDTFAIIGGVHTAECARNVISLVIFKLSLSAFDAAIAVHGNKGKHKE